MIKRRVLKQVSYGTGCVALLAGMVLVVVWLAWVPRTAPVALPTPTIVFTPIEVEQVFSVQHAVTIDIVARLRNRNARVGIAAYPVTFIVEDTQGNELARRQERSYILPGSLQYVAALAVPVSAPGRIRVEVPPEPQWQELPSGLRAPQLGSFLRGDPEVRTVGTAQLQQQRGIATNDSSYGVQRVEVVAVAFDAQKNVVGIGKTFLGELSVGEQREFTVQWPQPTQIPADIITSLSTNIFEEDNVIQVVGDPGSIR